MVFLCYVVCAHTHCTHTHVCVYCVRVCILQLIQNEEVKESERRVLRAKVSEDSCCCCSYSCELTILSCSCCALMLACTGAIPVRAALAALIVHDDDHDNKDNDSHDVNDGNDDGDNNDDDRNALRP